MNPDTALTILAVASVGGLGVVCAFIAYVVVRFSVDGPLSAPAALAAWIAVLFIACAEITRLFSP